MFDKVPLPRYKPRTILYLGVSAHLWSGALAVVVCIAVALYCLLTHRIPV